MRKITLLFFIFNAIRLTSAEGLNEEIGEGTGSAALALASAGFIYVLLRRAQVLSKKLGEEYVDMKKLIRETYRKFRKPLLFLHFLVNIAATLVAVIHGILMRNEEFRSVLFGWISASSMTILSLSGIFIWYRFKPIWQYRSSRTALRYIHRQWLFTLIFLVALAIHAG